MSHLPPLRFGLIGAGRIGAYHATTLARRLPEAELVVVADPAEGAARRLAGALGAEATADPQALIDDPRVEAVAITCASTAHADLVVAAAEAGKAVFVEKPMAMTLADADRAIAACRAAGVPLQVGFNRRFARDFAGARQVVADGGIGTPQLLRSLTRDPGLAEPGRRAAWTIFTQTLIHDFDALNWLNPGAGPWRSAPWPTRSSRPTSRPRAARHRGGHDPLRQRRARRRPRPSFSAAYGYDVRGEAFGSAGMVTAGTPGAGHDGALDRGRGPRHTAAPTRSSSPTRMPPSSRPSARRSARAPTPVDGEDARAALRIALACIESVETGGTVPVRDTDREAAA